MLESDIAISSGGQTIYELARIGVSTIGVCVAENQLQNTQGWKEASFLEYAGRYDDEDLERRLKNSLWCLVRLSVRSERSRIGRKVVDGQGCKRIVKAVVSI